MQYKIGDKVWYRHICRIEGRERKAIYEAFIVDITDDYFCIVIGPRLHANKANVIEVEKELITPRKT